MSHVGTCKYDKIYEDQISSFFCDVLLVRHNSSERSARQLSCNKNYADIQFDSFPAGVAR